MSIKQFTSIIVVWALTMLLLFCPKSDAAEIPLSQVSGAPTCEEAQTDLRNVKQRIHDLTGMIISADKSWTLVLQTERDALRRLGMAIVMFQKENCKEA